MVMLLGYLLLYFLFSNDFFAYSWLFLIDTLKALLSIGLLLYIVSEFLFGIGMGFYTLLSSRILGGISAALIQTSVIGIIGDISDEANRDKISARFQQSRH